MNNLMKTGCLIFTVATFNCFANESTSLEQVSFPDVLEVTAEAPTEMLSYGTDPAQHIRLWRATDNSEQTAANVIFIHGGCWLKDYDISHTAAASSALNDAGYNVWSIEYRRLGMAGGDWPGSLNDVTAAISYVQNKLNDEPVALMGHSAGGHLALLATANESAVAQDIDVVIGLAAITDMASYAQAEGGCNEAAANLMQTAYADTSDYAAASPNAQSLHSNLWLLRGSADSIVPMSQTDGLPVDVQVETIEGAGHFDFIHPQSSAWKALIQRLNKEFNE